MLDGQMTFDDQRLAGAEKTALLTLLR